MNTDLPCGKIEEPGGGATVSASGFRVAGWALDAVAPVQAVLITLDGEIAASVVPRLPRPDIASRYPQLPHAAGCGWQATLELSGARPGPVEVGLLALTAAGHLVPLDRVPVTGAAEPEDAARAACAFTIVQNESHFLPLWLSYYGRHFDPCDLFVLDHQTTDQSTAGLEQRCQVIRVHRNVSFDHYWLKATVERFQRFLLKSYRAVLFAEVDEFVMAHPGRYQGLSDYLRRMTGFAARCQGFEVVQAPAEHALRFEAPVLRQRSRWHAAPLYAKTLLTRVPLTWTAGFHEVLNYPPLTPDPDLVLAHLHRVDFDYCRSRHEAAAQRRWNADDLARGLGRQSRIVEPTAFRRWFYEEADQLNGPPLDIPEMWKDAF